MEYVVDPRGESDGQAKLAECFKYDVQHEKIMGKWQGVYGNDYSITQGEWQQVSCVRVGGAGLG